MKAAINSVIQNGRAAAILGNMSKFNTKLISSEPRTTLIPPDHWQMILGALPDYMKLLCEIIHFIGARQSEIRTMTWADFDDLHGRINLVQSQTTDIKEGGKKSMKLNERLTYALIEHREVQKRELKDRQHNFVFTNISGSNVLSNNQFYTGWHSTMKELKFTADDESLYHPHDLRRSRATALLSAGVNIADVMKQTGHKRPDVLLKVYNQSTTEKQDALADRIDEIDADELANHKELIEKSIARNQRIENKLNELKEYAKAQYWDVERTDNVEEAKRLMKNMLDKLINIE